MTIPQLPGRPNLEQLKRQAKELLQSARANDPAALARFRTLPAFAAATDATLARAGLALHDAQSVIAREHGFASWNPLRDRIEELTLEATAALQQFLEAATDGRVDRAERLLSLRPQIAQADFHAALLLGNAALVDQQLRAQPALATAPGGPRGWTPILYLCHNSLLRTGRADRTGSLSILRQLLALGADASSLYPWKHHGVQRAVLWAACCIARDLDLARLLLESGANPNDGVTLPLAAGGSDLATLELLAAHGADANTPWATDGSAALHAILQWATKPDGARWLLDHGANPDPVFATNGETPVHVAARKWDVAMVELLVSRGANPTRPRADGRSPYALAVLNGNQAVADWLLAHGAGTELSDLDRLIGACSRADRVSADALLRGNPDLRSKLAAAHPTALHQAAERGNISAVETMIACGFDPNCADEIGRNPLHSAAHEGQVEAVRVLLQHGASVHATDREFHAPPLIWAADGFRTHSHSGRDFAAIGRLLIAAGSPVDWAPGAEPAEDLLEIITEWRRTI